jgi:molybdenum cofactor biosynthesis enzyme MoaA
MAGVSKDLLWGPGLALLDLEKIEPTISERNALALEVLRLSGPSPALRKQDVARLIVQSAALVSPARSHASENQAGQHHLWELQNIY